MKRKIAIIGASDFQNPLILKAKEMGLETHVFAWESGDIGEKTADFFYPISITEIDEITRKCQEIGVSGICSIGTDLGNIAVCEVANRLGLCANSIDCVKVSTNKHLMREAFKRGGDPSPKSIMVNQYTDLAKLDLAYPIIVKPVDRSGSRCVTRLEGPDGLDEAVEKAIEVSFAESAVVEEFFVGEEYSVEFVSWEGRHHFLALTKKFTTGAPHFIETGHIEPADVSEELSQKIKHVVAHALDSLGIKFGASHSEILVNEDNEIRIVEIGSRMGGDCIGSDLVRLSSGVDFLEAVISIALGERPDLSPKEHPGAAMIRFMFSQEDMDMLESIKKNHHEYLKRVSLSSDMSHEIVDSSSRYGFFILAAPNKMDLMPFLPVLGV